MKRIACLLLLSCFLGCGGSEKPKRAVFDANDLEASHQWMQSVYDPVRQAEEQGNALLVTEAAEKAAKELKKIEGSKIQWTLNVRSLDRAEASHPEFAERRDGTTPTGFVVVLESPGFQMNDEEEDTLHLFFSRTKTAQESHSYLIHLDEKDRDYARTLIKGTPVQISATIQSIQSIDETGTGFLLKLTEAQLVR